MQELILYSGLKQNSFKADMVGSERPALRDPVPFMNPQIYQINLTRKGIPELRNEISGGMSRFPGCCDPGFFPFSPYHQPQAQNAVPIADDRG